MNEINYTIIHMIRDSCTAEQIYKGYIFFNIYIFQNDAQNKAVQTIKYMMLWLLNHSHNVKGRGQYTGE